MQESREAGKLGGKEEAAGRGGDWNREETRGSRKGRKNGRKERGRQKSEKFPSQGLTFAGFSSNIDQAGRIVGCVPPGRCREK